MPASDRAGVPAPLRFRETAALLALQALLLLLVFSVPPAGPLVIAAPVPALLAAWRAASWRHLLIAIALTHVPLWLVLCGWMLGVSLPAGMLFAPIMAMLVQLPVLAIRPVLRGGWWGRRSALLTVPLVFGALEIFRAELFLGGYPWFMAAHPLTFYPLLVQTADLFGAVFVGMLAVLPAAAALDVLRARSGVLPAAHARMAVIVTAALLAATGLYGLVRVLQTPSMTTPGPVLVAVQTNLAEMKSSRTLEKQVEDFTSFTELTIAAAGELENRGVVPDVFVWPETMVPGMGFEPDVLRELTEAGFGWSERFATWMLMLREIVPAPLMVGSSAVTDLSVTAQRIDVRRRFNAVYLIDEGEGPFKRYDKVALTPFGERLPWIGSIPGVRDAMIAIGAPGMLFDLSAGSALDPLGPIGPGGDFLATPVCFESTVSRVCRILVWGERGEARRAAAIVNVSNDAWFGRSRMARRQFVEICRLRSIETRSDLVRAANTGFSVHIDSAGKVVAVVGDGRYGTALESGWLVAMTSRDARRPLYAGVGRHFPLLVLVFVVGVPIVHLRTCGDSLAERSAAAQAP